MFGIKKKDFCEFLAQVAGVLSKELGLGLVFGIRNECSRLSVWGKGISAFGIRDKYLD